MLILVSKGEMILEKYNILSLTLTKYEKKNFNENRQAFGAPKTVVYMLARLVEPDAVITLSHEHQDFKVILSLIIRGIYYVKYCGGGFPQGNRL